MLNATAFKLGWRDVVSRMAFLAVLALAGCGGGSAEHGTSTSQRANVLAGGAEHPVDMFPVVQAPTGGEGSTIVHVGSVLIPRSTFVHWAKVLTPKLASYEPASRADCSSMRAPLELEHAKRTVAGLSPAQVYVACVRVEQGVVKNTALQQLISDQWVIGEAEELGLGVSDAEVQKRLAHEEAGYKSKAEFAEDVLVGERTLADAALGLRLSMATERILEYVKRKARMKLNQAAIARYYTENEKSFSIPETRDIRAIRTWTHAAIAKAMAEVHSGKSIADVATRVSIDRPSNENGGLIAGIVKGQEEPGLDEAIFAAKPHVLSGPLHVRNRYWAFEVTKVTPEQKTPFRAIEQKVSKKLSEELLNEEDASFIRAFRKKWLARTSCTPGYVVSRCREWRGPSVLVSENAYDLK